MPTYTCGTFFTYDRIHQSAVSQQVLHPKFLKGISLSYYGRIRHLAHICRYSWSPSGFCRCENFDRISFRYCTISLFTRFNIISVVTQVYVRHRLLFLPFSNHHSFCYHFVQRWRLTVCISCSRMLPNISCIVLEHITSSILWFGARCDMDTLSSLCARVLDRFLFGWFVSRRYCLLVGF